MKKPKGFVLPNFVKQNLEGFTLIELLVVVAIIGLLTSIVLVAVSTARHKANDGAIMQELAQVRTIAQMILVGDGVYDALCDVSNTLNDNNTSYPSLEQIEDKIETLNNSQNVTCYADENAYCVSTPLVYSAGSKFCIDGQGIASTINTDCTSDNKTCH